MFALRALNAGRAVQRRNAHALSFKDDENILILGNGALAREMFWHMRSAGHKGRIVMYSDYGGWTTNVSACRVINDFKQLSEMEKLFHFRWLVGVGAPVLKQKLVALARQHGQVAAPTYVHPLAHVSNPRCSLGFGGFVAPGALITTDVTLGNCVTVNIGATIGHDTVIGEYCTINPNAAISGNVRIGQLSLVGALAGIREGIVVGERATIGLGAAVVKNVADGETVVGAAAAPLVKSTKPKPVILRSMCVRAEVEPLD